MVRFVADSKQWKQIDADWPDFAEEPRNIRFGIATDGVNPFSVKRSTWSTWPIMLLNYNVLATLDDHKNALHPALSHHPWLKIGNW